MSQRRPLGTFDNAQALTAEHAAYNIVTAVRLSTTPDEDLLRTGLEDLVRRHPILRARIVKTGSRFLEVTDSRSLPLETAERHDGESWIEIVERELAFEFDLECPPLGRCTLLASADAPKSDLILTFPHALVDGTAVTQLISELLTLLAGGEALPHKASDEGLPASCDDLFPEKWRRPRRLIASLRFLGRQMAGEVSYRLRTRGRHSRPPVGAFRNRVLPLTLTKDETTALVRASRTHRVSMVAALEAAMLIAVARHCYPGIRLPHRYCAFPLLRRYLEPAVGDDVIACYVTVLRLTTEVSEGDELWELAARINRDLDTSMRRGERFLASIWSHFSMRTVFSQNSHRMSTTAVSYTGATPLPDEVGDFEIRDVHAFVSNFPIGPQYTAQSRLFRGRLWLDILYLDSDFDQAEAQAIADEMLGLLTVDRNAMGGTTGESE